MAANNQVVIIGRAGNNVSEDVRHLQSGSMVAQVRLAVNRPGKDEMGNSITDWLTCEFWNKQAETLAQFVQKGDLISVAGSVRVDSWEQEGNKRQKYFIRGENFQMLESRRAKDERRQMEQQGGSSYGGNTQGNYNNAPQQQYNNSAPPQQSYNNSPQHQQQYNSAPPQQSYNNAPPQQAPAAENAKPVDEFTDEFALDDDELPPF